MNVSSLRVTAMTDAVVNDDRAGWRVFVYICLSPPRTTPSSEKLGAQSADGETYAPANSDVRARSERHPSPNQDTTM